jgi:hypothetical protein
MEKSGIPETNLITIDSLVTQPISNKKKKLKKKPKKTKEKKCTGLKDLLCQISREKIKKIQKKEPIKNIKTKTIDLNQCKNYIEEENKDSDIKDSINNFKRTTSGTTSTSLSQNSIKCEYIDLGPNYIIKNLESFGDEKIDEEQINNKRKFSSAILDYYNGFDKILNEIHKSSIDMTNSMNFIKKEDFISSSSLINTGKNSFNDLNSFMSLEENNNNNVNCNAYIINKNNSIENDDYNNTINEKDFTKNIYDNKESISVDFEKDDDNNLNNEEYEYSNISYSDIMEYYNKTIPGFEYGSKFNLLNSTLKSKNIKYFNKRNNNRNNEAPGFRRGDWICKFCLNLNFHFRILCNRCKAPKLFL